MIENLYEKYANYFANKFTNSKIKKVITGHAEDIIHVEIVTKIPTYYYFMGVFGTHLVFDGGNVCDEGLDYDNIESINPQVIQSFIDEEFEKIKKDIENTYYVFYYDGTEDVYSISVDKKDIINSNKIVDRKKLPKIEDQVYDKIIVMNFYGDIIYEENVKTLND